MPIILQNHPLNPGVGENTGSSIYAVPEWIAIAVLIGFILIGVRIYFALRKDSKNKMLQEEVKEEPQEDPN